MVGTFQERHLDSSVRDHIGRHLQRALEDSADERTRYHIRSALQYLVIDDQ